MQRFAIVATVLTFFIAGTSNAQQRVDSIEPVNSQDPLALLSQYEPVGNDQSEISPSDLPPTGMSPEMWLYLQQLRRYDDPKQAVRRRAELRAAQRHNRISTMKWFGMSNSRPIATSTPFMGTYSPHWTSGNPNPFQWSGQGVPVYSAGNTEPLPRR